jgi:cystathionine beta-lyase
VAPSKTFNLAGLSTASVIISNPALLKKYKNVIESLHVEMGNLFGNIAAEAAYSHGDQWVDELLAYIDGNISQLEKFAAENLPKVKVMRPEATYMAWLDLRETGLTDAQLMDFMVNEAGLGLNAGNQFGPGGEGFMRINLACPRSVVDKALLQMKQAFDKLM